MVREERDTNGDGIFDVRIFYDKGQIIAQEADTNGDRRVDVWINFQNGEQVEQLEDQNYQGKITARYLFKSGQVIDQQQVANGEPPRASGQFAAVEEEVKYMTAYGGSGSLSNRASLGLTPVESGSQMK